MEIVNWSDYIKALCSDRDVEREAGASARTGNAKRFITLQ